MKTLLKTAITLTAIVVAVKVKKNKNYSKVFLSRDGSGTLKLEI